MRLVFGLLRSFGRLFVRRRAAPPAAPGEADPERTPLERYLLS